MFRVVIGDFFVGLLAIILIVFSFSNIRMSSQDNVELHIKTENGEWIYSLEEDRSLSFSGPIGETLVEIHDGKAAIIDSPCSEKTCVAAGSIQDSGSWSACLPNKVMIWIEALEKEAVIDAVSY